MQKLERSNLKTSKRYLRFHLKISLMNFLSMSILNGKRSLVLRCTSTFCQMELATTENTTIQNAIIITGVVIGSEKSTSLNIRNTAGINTAN